MLLIKMLSVLNTIYFSITTEDIRLYLSDYQEKNQISKGLEAESAQDVSIVHLPLEDSVKESVATTAEATDITADDVQVEIVNNSVSLSGNTDTANFCLSDFSLVAVISSDDSELITAGASYTYKDVLGDAVNYGMTANKFRKTGHVDSNFAVKVFEGGGNVTTGAYTGQNNGGSFVIAKVADGSSVLVDGSKTNVWCATNADKILFQAQSDNKKVISEEATLNNYVDGLMDHVKSVSQTLAAEN